MSDSSPDSIARRRLDWPYGQRFYLTLDLECDFGTALEENTFFATWSVDRLVALLERFDVPLTCFVQTELLEEAPGSVDRLRRCDVDVSFHPHSHTHRPRAETNVVNEIARSTRKYRDFFGEAPEGYRFPNGNVRRQDYRLLADHGYRFDASLFPSWRPYHFDNRDAPTVPHYLPRYGLLEVPFTVYSDRVRVPTALSYCRVLGRPFVSVLTRRPPPVVVFNVHMHDLVTPPSYRRLPPQYRAIYARNDRGFQLLETILDRFEAAGYAFHTIDEIHRAVRTPA